jgi:hypothetical protein
MSVRSDILGDIQTVISGIAGIGTVTAGKVEYVDLDNLTFPACFILQGPERKISGSTEHETFAWTVVIEVWCRDIDVEPFHAFVHQAMAPDAASRDSSRNTGLSTGTRSGRRRRYVKC